MKTNRLRSPNGFTLIGLAIVVMIVGIVALLILGLIDSESRGFSSGSGQRIGQIVSVGKQGVIHDTWEAELVRGGLKDGSGSIGSEPFHFTIEDPAAVKKAEGFMTNQTEVVVKYRKEAIYSPFRSDSHGYFLITIEPVTK